MNKIYALETAEKPLVKKIDFSHWPHEPLLVKMLKGDCLAKRKQYLGANHKKYYFRGKSLKQLAHLKTSILVTQEERIPYGSLDGE